MYHYILFNDVKIESMALFLSRYNLNLAKIRNKKLQDSKLLVDKKNSWI